MPLMPFEINVPDLSGQILEANLTEVGGVDPVNVVSSKQGFGAYIKWELCGWLAQWLPGNWRLSLLLESIGPGDEYSLPDPSDSVPLDSGTDDNDCRTWEHNIDVEKELVTPGTYRAFISLTYEVDVDTPGPMAGHADIGTVQIYA